MNSQKGLILKKENDDCLVLTPDGMFRHVRSSGKARAGEEIFLPSGAAGFKRILLLAASMCLLAFCCLFYQTNIAQAVTYVSLDFNSSLEIGLNRFNEVVSVKAFDKDAEKILKKANIKGQPVDRAVKTILTQARTDGYLVSSPKETLLVAVSPVKNRASQKVTAKEIAGLANHVLSRDGVQAKIIASAAGPKSHQEAGEKKISLGRYILQEAAKKEGKKITLQEIKRQKLADIEAKHEINLEKTFSEPNNGTRHFVMVTKPLQKQTAEKLRQQHLEKKKSEISKKHDSDDADQQAEQTGGNETVGKKVYSAPVNNGAISGKHDRKKNQDGKEDQKESSGDRKASLKDRKASSGDRKASLKDQKVSSSSSRLREGLSRPTWKEFWTKK